MRRLMLAVLAVLLLTGLTVAPAAHAEGPIVGSCSSIWAPGPWNQIWYANVDDGHLYGTLRVYMNTQTTPTKCVVLNKTDLYGSSSFVAVGIKRTADPDSDYQYDGNNYLYYAGPKGYNQYPQAGRCMSIYWDYYGSGGHHYAGQITNVACN